MNKKCLKCNYWQEVKQFYCHDDKKRGKCLYQPPTLDTQGSAQWPVTTEDTFCHLFNHQQEPGWISMGLKALKGIALLIF